MRIYQKLTLIDELKASSDTSRIKTAVVSQPAVTALQIALVSLLRSLGVQPAVVVGHSSGEIAAVYHHLIREACLSIRLTDL